MTPWIIVRTDLAKEHYVCRQIERMGYESWCPTELRSTRITPHSKARKMTEHPILPKRIFARVPRISRDDLTHIRYLVGIDRDGSGQELSVPNNQIAIFRTEIEAMNRDTIALSKLGNPRRKKAKWRVMQDALRELIEQSTYVGEVAA